MDITIGAVLLLKERMENIIYVYIENGQAKVLSLAIKKGNESYSIFIPIKEESEYPIPNKRQIAWQEAELGVVFHYDLHVFDGKKYQQRNNRIIIINLVVQKQWLSGTIYINI